MERQLKALAKNGSVNCVHLLLALVAERLAQRKRATTDTVKEAFDEAISVGLKAGFVSDTALIYHRAAIYFRSQDDKGLATLYIEKSVELYAQWEAWSVVRSMHNKYGMKAKDYSSSFSLVGSSPRKEFP